MTINIDNKEYNIIIERKNTKIIKYKVYPDLTIKLIVPQYIKESEIKSVIEKKKPWLKEAINHYLHQPKKIVTELKSGDSVPYLGNQILVSVAMSNIYSVELVDNIIVINTKNNNIKIEDFLDFWYKNQGYKYFNNIIDKCLALLKKYNIKKPDYSVRKMKTKWGSCIQKKNRISLNSELMKLSPEYIEYVVMHELCHLRHPNHSKYFYDFMSQVMPDWKSRKDRLNKIHI